MKKIVTFLLVATIALSTFASCGKKPAVNDDTLDDFVSSETDDTKGETDKATEDATDNTNNGNGENNTNNENNNNNNNDAPVAHTHAGGIATCTAKAKCATCGEEYGELNKLNHSGKEQFVTTPATHEKIYECCSTITLKEEAHKWSDGVCAICGHLEYKTTTIDAASVHTGNLLTLNSYYAFKGTPDLVKLQNREDRSKKEDGVTNSYTIFGETKDRYFATAATATALNDMLQAFYNATDDDNLIITGAYDTAATKIQDAIYSSGEAIALSYFHDFKNNGINDQRSIAGVDTYNWIYLNAHKYGFIATYPDSNVFKYIGVTHATAAFEKGICLTEYLSLLNKSSFENPVKINANNTHVAYYCSITEVKIPENYLYEISGNNMDGVIVTVFKDKLADPSGSESGSDNATVLPFEAANDFIYVLYPASLRATATLSASVLTEVPFGAKLTRSLKNDKWSKVTYTNANGATYVGYVLNDLITTNENAIVFGDQGEGTGENKIYPTFKLKEGHNYVLRKYPLADGYPNKFNTVSKYDIEAVGQLCGGDEVTVLEVSADKLWVKVRSTKVDKAVDGVYNKNYTSTAEGYILYEFLDI